LPEPVGPGTELGIGQEAVIVLHRPGGELGQQLSEARVVRLSARDGSVAWSKRVACAAASILHTRSRTFLACGLGPFGRKDGGAVVELDAKGNEFARISVSGRVQAHASAQSRSVRACSPSAWSSRGVPANRPQRPRSPRGPWAEEAVPADKQAPEIWPAPADNQGPEARAERADRLAPADNQARPDKRVPAETRASAERRVPAERQVPAE
jgi:hypothetical protein